MSFISYPDFSDNSKYLFDYLIDNNANKNFLMVWLYLDKNDISIYKNKYKNYKNLKFIKKNSILGLYFFIRSKHVFFTHGHFNFVEIKENDNKLINLWHGMPIKSVGKLHTGKLKSSQASNYAIVTSEKFAQVFSNAFNLKLNNILIFGQPRTDIFFKNIEISREYNRFLENNFIVFMPTFYFSNIPRTINDGFLSKQQYLYNFFELLDFFEKNLKKYNLKMIVKLHPMDFLCAHIKGCYNNITIFDNNSKDIDINILLKKSSGLITDISSVSIDYDLLEKPMFIKWTNNIEYKRNILVDPSNFNNCKILSYDYDYTELNDFFYYLTINLHKSKIKLSNELNNFKLGYSCQNITNYFQILN